jgi:hypothetical protein
VEFNMSTTGGGNGGSVCGKALVAQWVAAWGKGSVSGDDQ